MTIKTTIGDTTIYVSNDGRIFKEDGSEVTYRTIRNAQTGYENPYLYCQIKYNGKWHNAQVSRIVCQAFHPIANPEQMYCDHLDNNTRNNNSSNLAWKTRKSNNGRKHTRMLKSQNHKKTQHTDEYLKATNLETGEVRWYLNGRKAAAEIGCSHVLIYKAIEGIVCTHAMGWKCEWVSRDAAEAQEFKKRLEDIKAEKLRKEKEAREEQRAKRRAWKASMKENEKELKRLRRKQMKEAYRQMCEDLKKAASKKVWDKHAIIQLTPEGEFVAEYKSPSEAMEKTGITTIHLCLKGIQKVAGGYLWRYKNNGRREITTTE